MASQRRALRSALIRQPVLRGRLPSALTGYRKPEVKGRYEPRFAPLVGEFARLFSEPVMGQPSVGGALALYWQGEPVVDVWTGVARVREGAYELWQSDTLALSFSTGKAVLATLAHRLVERGLLEYDRPLAVDWPEFGQNGKASITLRDVLSHQSGLFDVRNLIPSAATLLDWEAMKMAMAGATPRFEPRTEVAYQAMTFGYLLGALIEKVTGEPLAVSLGRDVLLPLSMQGETYFGVPSTELGRVARWYRPVLEQTASLSGSRPTQKDVKERTRSWTERLLEASGHELSDDQDALFPKGISKMDVYGDRALQACMPSFNGVFTARALAKHYAMLAQRGQWQGSAFLSPRTYSALSAIQNWKRDRVMPIPMQWRLGYHRLLTVGQGASQGLSHVGYNGSGAWSEPSRGLSMAYVHNRPVGSITGDYRLWWLTRQALALVAPDSAGRS